MSADGVFACALRILQRHPLFLMAEQVVISKGLQSRKLAASTVTAYMSNQCRHFSSACIGCITEE